MSAPAASWSPPCREAIASIVIVSPHRQDDADLVVAWRSEAEQCRDVGRGVGRGAELLELINHKEDLARALRVLRRPGEDSVADLVGLARAHQVGELACLTGPCAGAFRGSADTIGEAWERIAAGAGLDNMPDGFVRTLLRRPAQAAAAERGP